MADEPTSDHARAENAAELTRRCLTASTRDPDQPVACMIGIAGLFLVIGVVGLFARPIMPVALPAPADEPVPVLFVPPVMATPTPATVANAEPELDQPTISAPQIVAVVPANSPVAFSLPTVGIVLPATPVAMPAPAPKAAAVGGGVPAASAGPAVSGGVNTNEFRPDPIYPNAAKGRNIQGRVLLRAIIGADGRPMRLELEKSSGSRLLDEAALAGVKRWVLVPGEVRHLQIPVDFFLK